MDTYSEEAVRLLSDLVGIESVTPWLVPEGNGESAIVDHIGAFLEHHGIGVEVEEIAPGRFNLLATLQGRLPGPTLCLNAHTDTVGYDNWRSDALRPRVEGDLLIGLGAADDKGGCAAIMLALKSLVSSPPDRGSVVAAFVADEEALSIGSERLVQREGIDAAIVIEPIGLGEVVVAHQGFGWIDIITHGVAAHGSAPDAGVDSIIHMSWLISALERLELEKFSKTVGEFCGKTVFHTSKISGGTDYATYPTSTSLGIEIGTQPGENLQDRLQEIHGFIAELSEEHPTLKADVIVRLEREPFVAKGHERILESLSDASRSVLGADPVQVGLNAWTDAGLLQSAGIPTILMGPTGGNFHAPGEWVSLPKLIQFCAVLEATARSYLR